MRHHFITPMRPAAAAVVLACFAMGCTTTPSDRPSLAVKAAESREPLPKIIPAAALRKALGLGVLSLKSETCPKDPPPGSTVPPPDCRYTATVRMTSDGYCLVIAPDVTIKLPPPPGLRDIEWQLDRTQVTDANLTFEFHERHGILVVVDDPTEPQFPGVFHKRLAPDLFQIKSLRKRKVNGIYLPAVVMRDSSNPDRVELCAAVDPKIVND